MQVFSPRIPSGGRGLDEVLGFHGLPASSFEGKTVYDLGCGYSDLGADLGHLGIKANVTGFDVDPDVLSMRWREPTEFTGDVVICDLDDIKAPDNSADIVLATYSLPMWGRSAEHIRAFYRQCQRLVRLDGLLSIYPIAVSIQQIDDTLEGEMERDMRVLAARMGASDIAYSPDWLEIPGDRERLKVRKIQ